MNGGERRDREMNGGERRDREMGVTEDASIPKERLKRIQH